MPRVGEQHVLGLEVAAASESTKHKSVHRARTSRSRRPVAGNGKQTAVAIAYTIARAKAQAIRK